MLRYFFLNIYSKEIDLTVLYESGVNDLRNLQYKNILNNKINSLNSELNNKIIFKIETFSSFDQFSKNDEYEDLSFVAGSDLIQERFNGFNPNKNSVLLITSSLNDTIYQKKNISCFKHILINRNSNLLENKELLFQLEVGVVALILKIFNVDLKNVSEFVFEKIPELIPIGEEDKCLIENKSNNRIIVPTIDYKRFSDNELSPKDDNYVRKNKFKGPQFLTDKNLSVGNNRYNRNHNSGILSII